MNKKKPPPSYNEAVNRPGKIDEQETNPSRRKKREKDVNTIPLLQVNSQNVTINTGLRTYPFWVCLGCMTLRGGFSDKYQKVFWKRSYIVFWPFLEVGKAWARARNWFIYWFCTKISFFSNKKVPFCADLYTQKEPKKGRSLNTDTISRSPAAAGITNTSGDDNSVVYALL